MLDAGGEHNCGSVLALLGITAESTMTHHWRVLRESGVIWQHPPAGRTCCPCGATTSTRATRDSWTPSWRAPPTTKR
ncbi:hypothetical protein ACIP4Y_21955 [Streptomyces sp. NPDC088810]|uniref:hypothetical protein n=1 Tax=Streptomyces sp. NPDC088810 TaxID=3365904 RepID=UPI003802BECE